MIGLFRRRKAGGGSPGGGCAPAPLPLDLLHPAFVQNPYPTYDLLRSQDPVHRSTSGAWMLTRYRDVHDALGDRRLSNLPADHAVVHARNRHRYLCADVAANILPFQDAPGHTGPRKLITRIFHEHLHQRGLDVEALARGQLALHAGATEMDVLGEFATPLSLGVMMELMGLPGVDRARLKGWSEAFFYLFAAMPSEERREQVDTALGEFREYFLGLIDQRRQAPGADLISALALRAAPGLGDVVIADTCMLLFADAVENVDAAIANAVLSLLRHPRQLRWLRKHPAALPAAVEECLRYESPAQFLARITLEEVEFHGVRIPPGSAVLLMLGAANRDPDQFCSPERLDLQREDRGPIGFGRGRHSCIGARLVKQQTEAALAVLFESFPEMSLTRAPVVWRERPGHRWPTSLPVMLTS